MFEGHPPNGAPREELRLYHHQMAADDIVWEALSRRIAYVPDGEGAWLEYRICSVCEGWIRYRGVTLFLVEYLQGGESSAMYLGRIYVPAGLTLAEVCEEAAVQSLERQRGHRGRAASELGISRKTFYEWLRRRDRRRAEDTKTGKKS